MRICVDIDGVLCNIRNPNEKYEDLITTPDAAKSLKELRDKGHYIILFTARHMKTTNSNVGLVLAKQGKVTLDWLALHGFEFDEIQFGKPYADIYIDDLAFKFESWDHTLRTLEN